jgi:hypothetical protein
MTLRSPAEDEDGVRHSTATSDFSDVRHSRMLLAGIQAESGLDPRLKHSGVTILEVASLYQRQFSKDSF